MEKNISFTSSLSQQYDGFRLAHVK